MLENKSSLYEVFKAKDARFDGRFFVGISSTGIYCRPVCRARQPKVENCNFFATAAEAEQAGFRPCLLCRPECAPGTSTVDASTTLAKKAARMLEENCGNIESLDLLAEKLGCTDRHLRRVFSAEFNVSPVQYLQTCRLLLAKNLLTDTDLSVLEVAMAAGFGSLRRFNALFKKHYELTPTNLRKKRTEETSSNGGITLALGYRPPYQWNSILGFLSSRGIPGVEVVNNGEYKRTVHLRTMKGKDVYGWVTVRNVPSKNSLSVTLSDSLLPVLPQVLARIRHLFDLYCEPEAVYTTLSKMNELQPRLCVLGTRLPGCFDEFEMVLRAILGQQITVKAARTLAGRIVIAYGKPIETEIAGLTHVFPAPEDILALEEPIEECFGKLGVIASRSKTIRALAEALVERKISFDFFSQPEEEIRKLLAIRGIGNWTAQYIAMRVMGWPDAFLETDVGVKKALKPYASSPKDILQLAEEWHPWRSYAMINLWNTLT